VEYSVLLNVSGGGMTFIGVDGSTLANAYGFCSNSANMLSNSYTFILPATKSFGIYYSDLSGVTVQTTSRIMVTALTAGGQGPTGPSQGLQGNTGATGLTGPTSPWSLVGNVVSYASGNVGIGLSNPTTTLQVSGVITTSTINTTTASLPLQVAGVTYATVTSSGLQGVQTPVVLFSQGTSGSFLGTGYKTIWIRLVGGGGGGSSIAAAASSGNASSVSGTNLTTMNAGGAIGAGTGSSVAGQGGTASGGNVLNMVGGSGTTGGYTAAANAGMPGGMGGSSVFGGAGYGGSGGGQGQNGSNGGGGGGASYYNNSGYSGVGGGAGGYCESIVTNPSGTYTVTIGSASAGGSSSGGAGYCVAIGYY